MLVVIVCMYKASVNRTIQERPASAAALPAASALKFTNLDVRITSTQEQHTYKLHLHNNHKTYDMNRTVATDTLFV
jgi:hypothetical protein